MELTQQNDNVLAVKDLRLDIYTRRGVYHVLNGITFSLKRGEVLGIAGESGSGKTTLGLTIIGLIPRNAAVVDGNVIFNGRDLVAPLREYVRKTKKFKAAKNEKILKKMHKEMRKIRGLHISMVFQEPMTSLNPLLQVGYQVAEAILYHDPASLARRVLARHRATRDDMRKIIDIIKSTKGDEEEVSRYIKERGLEGLEEQVFFIWRRQDLHESRKEKLTLSLCCENVSPFSLFLLRRVASGGMNYNRLTKRVLLREGYRKATELLSIMGIPNPDKVVKMYPHELSGGMRQRVVIAIALANNPDIVIMDEPTSALDVTVQAQVLDLVNNLKKSTNSSFIFISHDISVLSEVSDRIGIMYAGQLVEVGPTENILKKPLHPYTQLLMKAVPTLDSKEIEGIEGDVPDLRQLPSGCAFHPRCPFASDICRREKPRLLEAGKEHLVSCFLYGGEAP